jgi:hypothetical protein
LLPAAALLLAALVLRPVEGLVSMPASAGQIVHLGGSGSVLGALGGMRGAVAGGSWLRVNRAWEERDAATTMAWLKFTVAADGETEYFRLNGARMLAYDLPTWEVPADAPAAFVRAARTKGAERALTFLAEGRNGHPESPALLIEMANIRLRSLGDREGAAQLFRQAAGLPGAPYYAARIHAELLRELGRPSVALAWLREVLPTLPADDPGARRGVVEQRIKALEAELAAK